MTAIVARDPSWSPSCHQENQQADFGPWNLLGHKDNQLGKSEVHDLPSSWLEKALNSPEEKPWQQPRQEMKRQVVVKDEICEVSFHRAFSQIGSQGIRERWILKCSDGRAGRWGRSKLMLIKGTWELLPQFPEAQTGPQPPLFIGTPQKTEETVLFISFPIQMYFPFLTFLHSVLNFLQLLSHLFPKPINRS